MADIGNASEAPTRHLAELRAKAEQATPGPWVLGQRGGRVMAPAEPSQHVGESRPTFRAEVDGPSWRADAEFIAAANPRTILSLLDMIEQLQSERDAAFAVVERVGDVVDAAPATPIRGGTSPLDVLSDAVSAVPADALRERDARVAAAAVRAAALEARDAHLNTRRGTYAQGQNVIVRDMYAFLCARADRIRAQQVDTGQGKEQGT